MSSIKSFKLHCVVTDRRRNSLLYLVLRMRMKSYKRTSNISFSFSSTSPLKLELRSHYKIQMILRAIGPLSCLYLAKNIIKKGKYVTHIRRMSCTILFVFVIVCPYLEGNSLTVNSISHFSFHFDDKMEKLNSISLYRAAFCFKT